MPAWERPYGPEGPMLGVAALSILGLLPLCGFATAAEHYLWWQILVPVLFVALWQLVVWRVGLVGVLAGPGGIKVRHLARTRVIPWPAVRRIWIGPANGFDATTIWITAATPEGEREIETPLWRSGSRARHKNRIRLAPDEFYQVFVLLNAGRQAGDR
ncbi:PH domain-containing protein [Plantactinospora solaniradicis]|uniref:PH domain-containing protein n=1 Tax=Plantactinospora solaniradicis TaxID=1723736 RepID=A0ABW1KPG9_9ACTN